MLSHASRALEIEALEQHTLTVIGVHRGHDDHVAAAALGGIGACGGALGNLGGPGAGLFVDGVHVCLGSNRCVCRNNLVPAFFAREANGEVGR